MNNIYLEINSVPAKLRLAVTCWWCTGRGTDSSTDDGSCTLCNGKGMEITPNGKAIIELLSVASQESDKNDD